MHAIERALQRRKVFPIVVGMTIVAFIASWDSYGSDLVTESQHLTHSETDVKSEARPAGLALARVRAAADGTAADPSVQTRCLWATPEAKGNLTVVELQQRNHVHFDTRSPAWLEPVPYKQWLLGAASRSGGEWEIVSASHIPENAAFDSATVFDAPVYFGPGHLLHNGMWKLLTFGLWKSMLFANTSEVKLIDSPSVSLPQLRGSSPRPYFVVSKFGSVSNYDAVTCSGEVLTCGGCKAVATVTASMLRDHSTGRPPRLIDQVVVYLHNPFPTNLFHFLVEVLPRLETVADVLADEEIGARLLMPYVSQVPINRRVVEFLEVAYKVPRHRMVHLLHGQAAARVLVVPMPAPCLDQHPALLHQLRKRVFGLLPNATEDKDNSTRASKQKILVGVALRSGSRVILNFEHLLRHIATTFNVNAAESTIEIMRIPSTLVKSHTFLQQAALFRRVDILFGAHGANLANMLWMRPGTHVIEVMSAPDGNMCYFRLSKNIGLVHHLVLHAKGKQASFTVDTDEVTKHFRHAVERILAERQHRETEKGD